jgi:hypothetical protein
MNFLFYFIKAKLYEFEQGDPIIAIDSNELYLGEE